MTLTLHFHPLSSYCHKALIALYEHGLAFTPHLLDLGDEAVRTAYRAKWPIGKMPLLEDAARGALIPEATIVIEYLEQHYGGATSLIPAAQALAVRLRDRFFDLYVMEPMSKIVTDKLRPEGQHDWYGVEQARATLATSYAMLDRELASQTWAVGESFTMADCAAAPALFYAAQVAPLGEHRHVAAYLGRMRERPSYARVLAEAQPYFAMFPG